ncbi:hypothetical protein SAMN02745174_02351 [Cetobacterium ceti]|uniref:Uncharacterized protein n=1 Tax=Cetobacterium ceti TaxID=180163 RepID=A0A1T4QJH4_9FUSO|nr:hypothetical protein SAMN02745174_02351 [Cetobacterium ceti]
MILPNIIFICLSFIFIFGVFIIGDFLMLVELIILAFKLNNKGSN